MKLLDLLDIPKLPTCIRWAHICHGRKSDSKDAKMRRYFDARFVAHCEYLMWRSLLENRLSPKPHGSIFK